MQAMETQNEQEASGIQVQQLELPKGGGSLQGIGETFQPNEFSGTASLSLPVAASPCRDFEPQVQINYSSGSGNSPFGLGFSLSVPHISRATNKGTPLYETEEDHFVISGGDYLVPFDAPATVQQISGVEYQVKKYIPRKEGTFSLIEYWQPKSAPESNQCFWKITGRDHVISIFGKNPQAQIANPDNPDQVFSWLLEESYDAKGDHQLFFYKQENLNNVPDVAYERNRVVGAQQYLQRIQYGNNTSIPGSILLTDDPALTDQSQWHFEMVFDYGEYNISSDNPDPYRPVRSWPCRPDPFSTYTAGFEIRTYRRCANTLLFHRFKELGEHPVLVHANSYNYCSNEAEISIIASVTDTGYQWNAAKHHYETASFPDLKFNYTLFEPTGHIFEPLLNEQGKGLTGVNEPPNYTLVDLYGHGIPGILYANGQTTYYRKADPVSDLARSSSKPIVENSFSSQASLDLEEGSFCYGDWQKLDNFPIPRRVQGQQLNLTDVTGNGQLDLMLTQAGVSGYWEAKADGSWANFHTFESFPADFPATNQTWVDATGDGLADLFQFTKDNIVVYPSERNKGFAPAIVQPKLESMPENLNSGAKVGIHFADMTGTGMQHLVRIRSGEVNYWPNLSYGRFGEEITMGNAPVFPDNFDASRLFLVDVDGSGTADIIYMEAKQALLYLNYNGNTFSDAIPIDLPDTFSSLDQISFADVYGQGTSCMVYTEPAGSGAGNLAPKHYCYDFSQKQKPYLMNKVDNQTGAITEVEYGSSVDFYLADQKAGNPWITNIPFPVQVIVKTIRKDAISGAAYTSLYSYSHGYYDGVEREFRGFGRVDRQDTEYFPPSPKYPGESPDYVAPSLTKTWYETGCYEKSRELQEAYQSEYFSEDKEAFAAPKNVVDCPDPDSLPQAHAALAGTVIHSEVYGLDDSKEAGIPYSISESNYYVQLEQKKGDHYYASFFVYPLESLSYAYERNTDDPQIHQQFTLAVDTYGNVTRSCNVAYGRRNVAGALPEQQQLQVSCTTQSYINQHTADAYLLGVPVESQAYQINGLTAPQGAAFTLDEISQDIAAALAAVSPTNPSSDEATLLSWQQTLYAEVEPGGATKILELGTVSLPILVGRQQKAAFSNAEALHIFSGQLNPIQLEKKLIAGYYRPDPVCNYWWNPGLHNHYLDASGFYSPKETIDPRGHATAYSYDPYFLLLNKVVDALGNTTQALDIDYQTLHPDKLIDPNEQTSQVSFDPLGHVVYTTIYGYEKGEETGFAPISEAPTEKPNSRKDILEDPTKYLGKMQSFFYYDLRAWADRREPVYSMVLVAENFPSPPPAIGDGQPPIQIQLTYSDGFGRELQSKSKVEPGPAFLYHPMGDTTITKGLSDDRWLTSGRKEYNNKGKPVKEYEPYYINTPDYVSDPVVDTFGVSPTIYYDPLERVTQVITAKGYLTKNEWTAWENIAYDENDALQESPYYEVNILNPDPDAPYYDETLTKEGKANIAYIIKYFTDTPSTEILDNLGHSIIQQQVRQYPSDPGKSLDPSTSVVQEILQTKLTYDVLGRNLTSMDPRLYAAYQAGEEAYYNFQMSYAMDGEAPLKTISADAGTTWVLPNVFGNPAFSSDSRGIQITPSYDELHRLCKVHVKKTPGERDPLALDHCVQYVVYGDTPGSGAPEKCNMNGQVYQNYDSAGLTTISAYSLGGKPQELSRQLLKDYKTEVNWEAIDPLDPATAASLLEMQVYTTSTFYDALDRVTLAIDPDQNETQPEYLLSGLLNKLSLTTADNGLTTHYVNGISYNARGQRLTVRYGNNTITKYKYDPKTFAVTRINTWAHDRTALQEVCYEYDPVGNVFYKKSPIEDTQYYNGQAIAPASNYLYDSLYQLLLADGREKIGNGKIHDPHAPAQPFIPGVDDDQAIQNYLEHYTYDLAGNLIKTQHIAVDNSRTTEMVVSNSSNRAVRTTINNPTPTPAEVDQYFDAHGNQTIMERAHSLRWDYRNQLSRAVVIERASSNNDAEYYVYDSSGNRVRKVYEQYANRESTVIIKETIYLGHLEIRKTFRGTKPASVTVEEEYHSLRLMDGDENIATRDLWTVGKPPADFTSPIILYMLSDALGSCTLQVSDQGILISQEEYAPYGATTLFVGSASADLIKHYRYSGKERDFATGFYYYGARYYATWLGRWLSPDPAGTVDGLNLYRMVKNNPVTFNDPTGTDAFNATAFFTFAFRREGEVGSASTIRGAKVTSGAYGALTFAGVAVGIAITVGLALSAPVLPFLAAAAVAAAAAAIVGFAIGYFANELIKLGGRFLQRIYQKDFDKAPIETGTKVGAGVGAATGWVKAGPKGGVGGALGGAIGGFIGGVRGSLDSSIGGGIGAGIGAATAVQLGGGLSESIGGGIGGGIGGAITGIEGSERAGLYAGYGAFIGGRGARLVNSYMASLFGSFSGRIAGSFVRSEGNGGFASRLKAKATEKIVEYAAKKGARMAIEQISPSELAAATALGVIGGVGGAIGPASTLTGAFLGLAVFTGGGSLLLAGGVAAMGAAAAYSVGVGEMDQAIDSAAGQAMDMVRDPALRVSGIGMAKDAAWGAAGWAGRKAISWGLW